MQVIIFLLLAAIAVIAGVMVVAMKNPVHSALFLVITFLHMAGIYVLLGAEFIAIVQVLVYTGAILILFVFVVMLLQMKEVPSLRQAHQVQPILGPVAGVILLAEFFLIIATGIPLGQAGTYTPERVAELGGNTAALGMALYTQFLFPFEVASLLLLIAAIGAIVLAKRNLESLKGKPAHAAGISLAGKPTKE